MTFKHVPFLALALFSLASQAFGLSIAFGGSLGNITIQQLLEIPPGSYLDPCEQQCGMANYTIINCNNNDNCICSQNTGQLLQSCEQCLLEQLVDKNMKAPDPRVGSNPGLAAYVAACQSSVKITLNNIALTIPSNWLGSKDAVLSTPATVFVVGLGGILGASAVFLLSNM